MTGRAEAYLGSGAGWAQPEVSVVGLDSSEPSF